MSVAWFTKLYALNDAGRFDAAIKAARGFLKKRPKDWAVRLQYAKALLSVGELDACEAELKLARELTRGRAAWPWFYEAALHARRGRRAELITAMTTAVRLDARLAQEAIDSPFFAAFLRSAPFRAALRGVERKPARARPKPKAVRRPRITRRKKTVRRG